MAPGCSWSFQDEDAVAAPSQREPLADDATCCAQRYAALPHLCRTRRRPGVGRAAGGGWPAGPGRRPRPASCTSRARVQRVSGTRQPLCSCCCERSGLHGARGPGLACSRLVSGPVTSRLTTMATAALWQPRREQQAHTVSCQSAPALVCVPQGCARYIPEQEAGQVGCTCGRSAVNTEDQTLIGRWRWPGRQKSQKRGLGEIE